MVDFGTLFDWSPVEGCLGTSFGCTRCPRRGAAVTLHPDRLLAPLALTAPRDVLVGDHGDLFAPQVPHALVYQMLAVVAAAPDRQFYLSTKYIRRAAAVLTDLAVHDRAALLAAALAEVAPQLELLDQVAAGLATWPLPNLHLGTSCETHCWLMNRAPWLLSLRVAHRWLAARPLLGGYDLGMAFDRARAAGMPEGATFDFVVLGAEAGDGARPLAEADAASLEAQCAARGIETWRLA